MKNVAKSILGVNCESVNHRVFERKLHPKPLGRGHAAWASRTVPPHLPPRGPAPGREAERRWTLASVGARPRLVGPAATYATTSGGFRDLASRRHVHLGGPHERLETIDRDPGQWDHHEFKHINKRRKRNLQGFPSNGERTGKSPLENRATRRPNCSLEKRPRRIGSKSLEGAPERVRAPSCPDPVAPRGAVGESGCLGMQPQSGGKFRPRLNTGERPIANKYREGKMKRTLKRESKSA
ncbi:hypothetical protein AAG906_008545 [Vitis piasezkii]